MNLKDLARITNFFFETGTMRKLLRMHSQVLLTDDLSDNIASHSYRVALIAWILAKMEGVDPYKVVMMALLHDITETRSGDHNWVAKKYVKIYEEEIREDQLGQLPYKDFSEFLQEYDERESLESIVVKDADLLDEILLLREYSWQGNKESAAWLRRKKSQDNPTGENMQMKSLKTESARKIGKSIMKTSPSAWWENIWTSKNR